MSLQHLIESAFKKEEILINGEKYLVKEMSAGEYTAYQKTLYTMVNNKPIYKVENAVKNLVLYTLHDIDGNRIFKDTDAVLLDKMPQSIVDEIYNHAAKVNGLDQTEDEVEKN